MATQTSFDRQHLGAISAAGAHRREQEDEGVDSSSESESENEVATHLRTQFLRRVAHDIASPTGVTMTVLEELAGDSSRPELVTMARRGLRRLLRLSEQLALAAELETGTLSPEPTPEDLRTLAKEGLSLATGIDGRREVSATCDAPEEKVPVNVDRKLLITIIREVIGNALRLASSRVTIDVSSRDGKAVVRVVDDGTGFPEEVLATIGKRFTPHSTARGLGLSLSMAKQIARAHGGDLRIEPGTLPPGRRGGRGAAVSIELPLR